MADDFYLRYYVGHKGKFGHEFLEFEFNKDGRVRDAVPRRQVELAKTLSIAAYEHRYICANAAAIRKQLEL
jgi:hypothetical protein